MNQRATQRGIVLVSSLLLLIVVTIMALSMFRSFGLQEKIAGTVREKHRAVQAAQTAQQFAENWLSSGNNVDPTAPTNVVCNSLLSATPNAPKGQICSNTLASTVGSVTKVPWKATVGGADVGVSYTPPNFSISTSGGIDKFYDLPRSYITDVGASPDINTPGEVYQIDAYGYGGTVNTVAVVESTFVVYSTSINRTL